MSEIEKRLREWARYEESPFPFAAQTDCVLAADEIARLTAKSEADEQLLAFKMLDTMNAAKAIVVLQRENERLRAERGRASVTAWELCLSLRDEDTSGLDWTMEYREGFKSGCDNCAAIIFNVLQPPTTNGEPADLWGSVPGQTEPESDPRLNGGLVSFTEGDEE